MVAASAARGGQRAVDSIMATVEARIGRGGGGEGGLAAGRAVQVGCGLVEGAGAASPLLPEFVSIPLSFCSKAAGKSGLTIRVQTELKQS